MGIIGPTTRFDLDIIRTLRNEFAHSRASFSFETPEVRAVCDQLKIPDMPQSQIPFPYLNKVPESQLASASDKKHPRTRFITTCHSVAYRMQVAKDGVRPGDDNPLP